MFTLALDAAAAISVSCNSIILLAAFLNMLSLRKLAHLYVIEAFNELSRSYSRIVGF